MDYHITGPRFVLAVHDLAASTRFYCDVLDFRVDFEVEWWAFLSRDKCRLMLGECRDAKPAYDLGDHSYFAYLEIVGIDELYESVGRSGTRITSVLEDKPWGMREFGIRTIDGHRIMFGQEL